MGFVTRICQIWAPIPWGPVISHVANILSFIWSQAFVTEVYWGLSYMGRGFVIYGECPHIDKYHPLVTNPNPPQWVVKIKSKFSTNERPGNWSCDAFSTNHKALFQDFKSLKGYPLLKYFIGICHIWGEDLSFMGSVPILTNTTHLWQTPILLSG